MHGPPCWAVVEHDLASFSCSKIPLGSRLTAACWLLGVLLCTHALSMSSCIRYHAVTPLSPRLPSPPSSFLFGGNALAIFFSSQSLLKTVHPFSLIRASPPRVQRSQTGTVWRRSTPSLRRPSSSRRSSTHWRTSTATAGRTAAGGMCACGGGQARGIRVGLLVWCRGCIVLWICACMHVMLGKRTRLLVFALPTCTLVYVSLFKICWLNFRARVRRHETMLFWTFSVLRAMISSAGIVRSSDRAIGTTELYLHGAPPHGHVQARGHEAADHSGGQRSCALARPM